MFLSLSFARLFVFCFVFSRRTRIDINELEPEFKKGGCFFWPL